MDIKTVFGITQGYGQSRVKRGGTGDASAVSRGSAGEASGASGADKVTLSGDAKLVSLAATVAKDSPDTRSDRVAELKAQVEAGTYQPDSRKIAEKMLTMESDLFG